MKPEWGMTLSRVQVLDPLSAAGHCLRCWQVRNECIPGMSSNSFEWAASKLGVRTDQRLAKTLDFPAQQKSVLKKKKKKSISSVAGLHD
jgi:hypothetical protein